LLNHRCPPTRARVGLGLTPRQISLFIPVFPRILEMYRVLKSRNECEQRNLFTFISRIDATGLSCRLTGRLSANVGFNAVESLDLDICIKLSSTLRNKPLLQFQGFGSRSSRRTEYLRPKRTSGHMVNGTMALILTCEITRILSSCPEFVCTCLRSPQFDCFSRPRSLLQNSGSDLTMFILYFLL
jgi:hypothetical protein